jgi:hypothetical protein
VASRNNSRLLIYRAGGDAMLPSNPITTSVEGDFEIPQIEASNELLSQGRPPTTATAQSVTAQWVYPCVRIPTLICV